MVVVVAAVGTAVVVIAVELATIIAVIVEVAVVLWTTSYWAARDDFVFCNSNYFNSTPLRG